MLNSGIIASRHRGEYFLRLNGVVNNDYLRINPNDFDLNIPTTGYYYIECTFDTSNLLPNVFQPIFGRLTTGLENPSWGISMTGDGRIQFRGSPTGNANFFNFLDNYPNQIVTVRGVWLNGGGLEMYINNALVATGTGTVRPDDSGGWCFVNGAANSGGQSTPRTDLQADFDIYEFDINGNKWYFPEGKGFVTKSNNFDIAEGLTDNAGGLTYWNINVWQLI